MLDERRIRNWIKIQIRTNNDWSGSGRSKTIWIRIHNTAISFKFQGGSVNYASPALPRVDLDHVAYRKWLRAEGLDTSLVDPDVSRYTNRNLSSLESPLVVGSESGKDLSVFDMMATPKIRN